MTTRETIKMLYKINPQILRLCMSWATDLRREKDRTQREFAGMYEGRIKGALQALACMRIIEDVDKRVLYLYFVGDQYNEMEVRELLGIAA